MRRHHEVEGHGIPFFMIENVPDLGSSTTDLQQLLSEIDRFRADKRLQAPRAVVLDTLARCMGEGDENTAKDMGRFVTRCGAIERHFGCVVVVVHHMGKDASKGGRGSNALNGAADVTMTVEKSDA
jgi:RecA-family ATPase